MTFVGVAEPCHSFAIGQLQPAPGALESLDVRLLVDRKHHCVLGRLQVGSRQADRLWADPHDRTLELMHEAPKDYSPGPV
jgi:hypothetical protein